MTFYERVSGAIRLQPRMFAAVEVDLMALPQAALVVAASATAMTIGLHGAAHVRSIVTVIAGSLLTSVFWSWVAFFAGSTLFKEQQTNATWGHSTTVLPP